MMDILHSQAVFLSFCVWVRQFLRVFLQEVISIFFDKMFCLGRRKEDDPKEIAVSLR